MTSFTVSFEQYMALVNRVNALESRSSQLEEAVGALEMQADGVEDLEDDDCEDTLPGFQLFQALDSGTILSGDEFSGFGSSSGGCARPEVVVPRVMGGDYGAAALLSKKNFVG